MKSNKKSFSKVLFGIFFFNFIFLMINREFTPFGIDYRVFNVILMIILLFNAIVQKGKLQLSKLFKKISLFYFLIMFSNLSWLFNGLALNKSAFYVILVSYVYNYLALVIFEFYKEYIKFNIFKKDYLISMYILVLSILISFFGVELSTLGLSSYTGYVADISQNFLGSYNRYAGFSQDPNYTSLFLIIGILTCIYDWKNNKVKLKIFSIALFIACYLLSASKTILVALIIALIYVILPKKYSKTFNNVFIYSVFLIPIIMVFSNIKIFEELPTMSQRMSYWKYAKELFFKNPLMGNGLTSFRTYFLNNFKLGWYVQSHSTIFQILSENGIICLLLFINILKININNSNWYCKIINIIFLIFLINTETLYHTYSVFILGILPLIIEGGEKNEEECNSIHC